MRSPRSRSRCVSRTTRRRQKVETSACAVWSPSLGQPFGRECIALCLGGLGRSGGGAHRMTCQGGGNAHSSWPGSSPALKPCLPSSAFATLLLFAQGSVAQADASGHRLGRRRSCRCFRRCQSTDTHELREREQALRPRRDGGSLSPRRQAGPGVIRPSRLGPSRRPRQMAGNTWLLSATGCHPVAASDDSGSRRSPSGGVCPRLRLLDFIRIMPARFGKSAA